jgi:hypothetical protein
MVRLTAALPIAALAAILAMTPLGAQAGIPMEVKEKCPVGGESFTYTTTASYSTFGQRPDGKPYGSWTFPLALPVCPGNGLVMYKEFSATELARLPALIGAPEYRALKDETVYYRAARLARALDPADDMAAWLLLSATWEAEHDEPRVRRYQAEFVRAVAELPKQPQSLGRFALQVRAANALRESGLFDEAGAALRSLPRDALTPPGADSEDARENRKGWTDFIARLDTAIARRDAGVEPLDLIPAQVAAGYCLGYPDGPPPRKDPLCTQPPIAEAVTQMKAMRAKYGR